MKKDEIAIGDEISPGVYRALRRQDGKVREVRVRVSDDGDALHPGEEIADLGPSSCDCGDGHWRELTSIYKLSGPPQVATPAYRKGYDRIFGGKQKVGEA